MAHLLGNPFLITPLKKVSISKENLSKLTNSYRYYDATHSIYKELEVVLEGEQLFYTALNDMIFSINLG